MSLPKYTLEDINEMIYWGQAKTHTVTDKYHVYIVHDMHNPKVVTGYYAHAIGTEKLTGIANMSQLKRLLQTK